MKKFLVRMMAIGVVLSLFAPIPVIYAAEGEQTEAARLQVQEEQDNAAWEAWRVDFAEVLDANKGYAAAKAAAEEYDGESPQERAMLEACRDAIYYALARPVYEHHFGPWEGDHAEFCEFLQSKEQAERLRQMISTCADSAIETCGAGKVKQMSASAGGGCSFECGTP